MDTEKLNKRTEKVIETIRIKMNGGCKCKACKLENANIGENCEIRLALLQREKEVVEKVEKYVEEIIPKEMALGRENPFLKIMYDHAPNNAKFYEDNVDKINNFRTNLYTFLSTINNKDI